VSVGEPLTTTRKILANFEAMISNEQHLFTAREHNKSGKSTP